MSRRRSLQPSGMVLAISLLSSACSPQLVKQHGALAVSLTSAPLLVTKAPLLPPEDPPAPPPTAVSEPAPVVAHAPVAPASPPVPAPTQAKVPKPAPALSTPPKTSAAQNKPLLWARLTAGFKLAAREHPEVQRAVQRYAKHHRSSRKMLTRAEPFLYDILVEIEARKLPTELALVPAVESHFNPFAYSPRHAAGLWQFIPGTARQWGLKNSPWYDARLDTRAATEAALDYLQFLYLRFDDWLLALAAYNAGEGRVDSALAAAKGRAEFWQLKLPKETRRYVPNLLGLAELIANPKQYGIDLPPLPNRAHLIQVPLPGQMPLARAADLAGMSLADLQQINPAMKRAGTDPDGPHHLYLQPAAAKRLANAMRSHAGGGALAVTQAGPAKPKAKPSKPVAKSRPTGSARRFSYTVQEGDTLWDVSRTHHLSTRKLAAWNGLAPDSELYPGQRLTLWLQDTPHAPGFTAVVYTVGTGETLASIARRFELDLGKICAWNGLARHSILAPGLKLKLLLPRERRRTAL